MTTRNCAHCARLFEIPPGMGQGRRRYCSPDCQEAARHACLRRAKLKMAARRSETRSERLQAVIKKRDAIRQERLEAYLKMPAVVAARQLGCSATVIRRAVIASGLKPTWAHRRPIKEAA